MFSTTYHAVSVTKNKIRFCCPEVTKTISEQVKLVSTYFDEFKVEDFIRHFNRIQTSGSKKTKIEMERNQSLRYYGNRRENEHRSKERVVLARR